MKKFDLQMYAEAIQGKKLVYLYRIKSESASADGAMLAFTTENERTKSKDSDSVATKDGSITVPGATEQEITATSLLAKGDTLVEKLEDALDNDELIEIWEANLDEPAATGNNKFKGRYFQGYLTEVTIASNAEDHVEVSLTFAVNGNGAKGDVTVSVEQQEVANYVFADTAKTGA
jgi:TP901-1 family phage major tail protein